MFWLHEEDLPAGVGGEPFCSTHLVYIAFFLIATIGYVLFYRKLDKSRRKTADRILGSLVVFFALCEYGITAIIGRFDLYTLPIHLCSILFSLTLIHAWTNDAQPDSGAAKIHHFLSGVIFHPGILGAWAALLFPDWLRYPFWNYLSISGFLAHGILSLYGASLLVIIAETPDPAGCFLRDLKNSTLFLLAGAVMMFIFDRITGTNYWFMNGPGSDSPLAAVCEGGGIGAYLIALFLIAAAVTVLWYGLRYFFFVRKRE